MASYISQLHVKERKIKVINKLTPQLKHRFQSQDALMFESQQK